MSNQEILEQTFDAIKAYIDNDRNRHYPVVKYHDPDQLSALIDLSVNDAGIPNKQLIDMVYQYLEYSVHTGNKQFLNQLYAGFNLPAFIGDVLTTLANTSMYTYEVAPVATMIEYEMIRLMNSYVGYANGDGIFLSGGSNGNLVAMFSARNRIQPQARLEGYDRTYKLTAFVNEHAHYSFETAASLLGIGSNQVIKVQADSNGRMIPTALDEAIQASLGRGEKPFFVAATCATTLHGAFDPIDEIAEVCDKHNLWLHADGSFGGSVILSDQHRHLVNGIERTDSFVWNPHKLMNIPLICSALLVREKGRLQANITDINTDYIYHDIDQVEDLGKKSIQCGRRVDAVKLWFAWKYYGKDGYKKRIDRLIELAKYAEKFVISHPSLELMVPRQSFTVCFRFLPDTATDLNAFNLQLREKLRRSGKSIVNYGYTGRELTIRLVTANADLDFSDLDQFFNNLIEAAMEMEEKSDYETEDSLSYAH
jgi:glutamate/tyrosine decarboxylase-like PLP-dependent enzyme